MIGCKGLETIVKLRREALGHQLDFKGIEVVATGVLRLEGSTVQINLLLPPKLLMMKIALLSHADIPIIAVYRTGPPAVTPASL